MFGFFKGREDTSILYAESLEHDLKRQLELNETLKRELNRMNRKYVQLGKLYHEERWKNFNDQDKLAAYKSVAFDELFEKHFWNAATPKEIRNEILRDTDTTGKQHDKSNNILEVKLKDIDSVPEVWYEGVRLDKLPESGLVSIDYSWKTKGHNDCFDGLNSLDVEWFGPHKSGFRK